MSRHEHTQIGYVTGGALIAALPLLYAAFMAEDGELGVSAPYWPARSEPARFVFRP
ncbi:MAG: hypothetical protein V5A20_12080 [Salinibacter sp.]|jgi:hypothetical protein|uniref:hypothetical protein n=1 Tax=Salinibacter sp. TaxID=2065818 RepID=UPI002FC2BF8A